MRVASIVAAAAPLLLLACSDTNSESADRTAGTAAAPANGSAPAAATAPVAALGLTSEQLEDADILEASGAEIGEVERVVTDASGTVSGLLVEVEDSDPDRYVNIPLDGLSVVEDGDDRDLRSAMTRAQLNALPAATR